MAKYLIEWDAGYGKSYDVVEAADYPTAEKLAYEAWQEEVDGYSDHEANLLTPELAEEHGFESELENE